LTDSCLLYLRSAWAGSSKSAPNLCTAHNNFTTFTEAFDCVLAASQVDCLRNVSWQNIEHCLAAEAARKFAFIPVANEPIVFSNYPQRYEVGAFLPVPAIVGTNKHELNVFGLQVSSEKLAVLTNQTFLCIAARTSQLRQAHSQTTYRYRYDGNFSNVWQAKFTGAYHGADSNSLGRGRQN
jgi:carboxylesterase type B